MNKELQNQIDKVMYELQKLHEMLPADEQMFYFEEQPNNLLGIGQMIATSISIAETIKEILVEDDST
jgi:hypothetical protein